MQGAKTGESYGGPTRASLDGTLAALGYDKTPGAIKVRFNDPSGYAVGTAWLNRYGISESGSVTFNSVDISSPASIGIGCEMRAR